MPRQARSPPTPSGAVPGGLSFAGRLRPRSHVHRHGLQKGTPLSGKVLAGSDWVLLRDDGVAVFDTKITFSADNPGPHVFDAELFGQVNVKGASVAWPISTVDDWKKLDGNLGVSLPIQFETRVRRRLARPWRSRRLRLSTLRSPTSRRISFSPRGRSASTRAR